METHTTAIAAEHVDVIIVGAGISGVGSAYRLQQDCPEKTYLVLEGKDTFGGTWDTHKYPGVRSDSDLYTFGYSFRRGSATRSPAPMTFWPIWAR